MTDLLENQDLVAFSITVAVLARARPSSAGYVTSAVPAKVSNFLVKHRGVDARDLMAWTQANPAWADALKATVRDSSGFLKRLRRSLAL